MVLVARGIVLARRAAAFSMAVYALRSSIAHDLYAGAFGGISISADATRYASLVTPSGHHLFDRYGYALDSSCDRPSTFVQRFVWKNLTVKTILAARRGSPDMGPSVLTRLDMEFSFTAFSVTPKVFG